MPKVNPNYFDSKRNEILDAAYRVCMQKPVYEVSMRDIIAESGFSQGGIYRYYSNIDDIFINLINQKSKFYNVELQIEKVIASAACPEKIVGGLLLIWKKVFLDNLVGVGKIYYELTTLYANYPDKLAYFTSKNTLSSEQSVFEEKSLLYVAQKIEEGYFVPKIPFKDIISLLVTSLDGIIRDLILTNCYIIKDQFPIVADLNAGKLIYSLSASLILLLGGNEKFIKREDFYDGRD